MMLRNLTLIVVRDNARHDTALALWSVPPLCDCCVHSHAYRYWVRTASPSTGIAVLMTVCLCDYGC